MPSDIRRTPAAPALLAVGALLALGAAGEAGAQDRLLDRRTAAVWPTVESWRLGEGLAQAALGPEGDGRVTGVSQLSIPIALHLPLADLAGARWALDVGTAYASGTVTFDQGAAGGGGSGEYTLSGVADVRLRAVGSFLDGRALVTLGTVAPTGATELGAREFAALRVLAAPVFALSQPVLGAGGSASAGLVLTQVAGAWALALGGAYDHRLQYTPAAALASGITAPEFSPGRAVRLSLGANRLVGRHALALGLSTDLYGQDELAAAAAGAAPPAAVTTQLGPVVTLDAQLRLAPPAGFRDVTLSLANRYRFAYERAGAEVVGSSGNYLDAGLRVVRDARWAGARTALVLDALVRHQTGLDSDSTLATAAALTGGLGAGLAFDLGGGLTLQPMGRVQLGRIEAGTRGVTARSLGASVILQRSF